MDYLDLELEIGTDSGGAYAVIAHSSPGGDAHATMQFPFDEQTLANQLSTLQNVLTNSVSMNPQILSSAKQSIQNFGQALFNALFTGAVHDLYVGTRSIASFQSKGVRLKLSIQAAELAALPWEFVYDPSQQQYLCLHDQTSVMRYLDLLNTPPQSTVTPPLSLLGMIASPTGPAALDIEHEKQVIEKAIAGLSAQVQLTWLAGQTWEDLQQMMLSDRQWHIFHFIGHGGFDSSTNEGFITLADSAGQARNLSATQLGQLLADHPSLRLVVLNSCAGASGNTRDIFSSTAATLIQQGIPAVLANQYAINDEAAIALSRAFYETLASGWSIDTAVGEARKAIDIGVNPVAWGVPVLHTHTPDGVLFNPSAAKALYPPANAKLVLDDPLSQPFHWVANPVDASGGSSQFTNGAYHMHESHSSQGYLLPASSVPKDPFSNLAFEIQITFIQDGWGGIIFRANDTTTNYYTFEIDINGHYYLAAYLGNNKYNTLAYKSSPVISTGLNRSNTIAVVANGSTLDLYVNHTKVDSVGDSTYTGAGHIGLIVESGSTPTEVAFSNAKVWTW
jgi:CHAT domain-containing protein